MHENPYQSSGGLAQINRNRTSHAWVFGIILWGPVFLAGLCVHHLSGTHFSLTSPYIGPASPIFCALLHFGDISLPRKEAHLTEKAALVVLYVLSGPVFYCAVCGLIGRCYGR